MGDSDKILDKGLNRREFLMGVAATGALLSLGQTNLLGAEQRITVSVFSKHFQWLDYDGMAQAVAEVGFDGVDLTVRKGGHVEPERVEEDLPKAAEACKKAGIKIHIMTTDILDPKDPVTEKVLRTASKLGIGHYRFGYWHYDEKRDILEQLKEIKVQVSGLAELNKKYKIVGGNHNHTGNYVGGSIWDSWELLKGLDTEWTGCHWDTGNAYSEGAGGTWKTNVLLIRPLIKSLIVKTKAEWGDSGWKEGKKGSMDKLRTMAPDDYIWCFKVLKSHGFSGPVGAHYEFSGLGGAENGSKTLKGITRDELLTVMRRNLGILKEMMHNAELL